MPYDLSIEGFNLLLTKAEGRDKVARFAQYLLRAFVGFSGISAPQAGTPLKKLEDHARNVMTNLASARRTHRWCKEFPVIQSIPKSLAIKDPFDMIVDLVQKVSLATFMMIDHVGLLKQWKIITGGKRSASDTIQLGLKFFCLSNCMGFIAQARKLLKLSLSEEDKASEKAAARKAAFKHFLLIIQTSHLSLLYQTHDAFVGICGAITSGMDVQAQWPQKKPVADGTSK